MSEEFFIGWEGRAPEATGRFVKRLTIGLVIAGLLLAMLLPAFQSTVAEEARWEFGNERTFRGILVKDPVPMLVGDDRVVYLLVHPFKFGFDPGVADRNHLRQVTLEGTRIHRDGTEMIEVRPGTLKAGEAATSPAHPLGPEEDLGEVTLRGEIVDSKCFLGVMNPGSLKPHRACAINCIQGGIPPVLLVRDREGRATCFLLVGEEGESLNAALLDLVALPVAVTGRLKRRGEQLILHARPGKIAPE